ncbi:DNA translocase FtsK 4TM domain-containing protein [Devosia sp.]|uniref:DNA translocase FtsK n=1 Tax=Devosia sp. TaxID=1871048 RepID=UPI003A93CA2C
MPAQQLLETARDDQPPAIAIRIPTRLLGAVMLGLVAVVLLSLASWSVDDPSFSYASGEPARNWLGFPGAVIADLSFQVFGLGILALLAPPALWGWSFMRRRVPRHMGLRVLAWLVAGLLSCGVFALIVAPASWPLPLGMGGLIGSGFVGLATLTMGENPQQITGVLFAIILAAPTLALFWGALGFGRLNLEGHTAAKTKTKAAAAKPRNSRTADVSEPEDDDDTPERNSMFDVVIGGAVHLGYSAKSAYRRAKATLGSRVAEHRAAAAETESWREVAVEPSIEGEAQPEYRHEPQLVDDTQHMVEADYPDYDDDAPFETDFDDVAYAPAQPAARTSAEPEAVRPTQQPSRGPMAPRREPAAQQPVVPTARVTAPAPRPQTGSRAMREAQGSMFDDPAGFELPPLNLLSEAKRKGPSAEHAPERLEMMARKLEGVLEDFGVKGDIINVRPGPVVTLYELEPAPGIKSSRVISLADDIARSMSAISARVAVVPGRNAIGIELPNENRETVFLSEMLASSDFEKMKGKLPICLGKTIGGEPIIADLARMPHLLIAGTTGSGKSVGINTFILSLLYQMTPEQCRLIMIDPKMLELSIYDGIPHLLTPVVTDPHKAVTALKWAVREMEDRYRKMSKIGVRNIDGFNQRVTEAKAKGEVITRTVQTGFDHDTGEPIFESEEFDLEPLPYIVVIVDEMADLMMVAGKDIEGAIQRLAQMARAAGIHMITATQRPSVDVITGTIKANFPTRISFMVTSKIDSRTILGEQGAEQLLGNGDMLYMAGGGRIRRLHGPFVADSEVESIVAHLKSQGTPDYLDSITAEEDEQDAGGSTGGGEDYSKSGDELYDKAVNVVLTDKKVSTSYIQRRLAIGYNKAATLVERMEQEGVISAANHAGKREILVGDNADGY